jgi:hypothetical protein
VVTLHTVGLSVQKWHLLPIAGIYMFCTGLITEIIPVYKGGECSLRGTSWNFKYSSLSTAEVPDSIPGCPVRDLLCTKCNLDSPLYEYFSFPLPVFHRCFIFIFYILLLAGQTIKIWELSKNSNAVLESGEHWIKKQQFHFFSDSLIPPLLRTQLHLKIFLTRRTNRLGLGNRDALNTAIPILTEGFAPDLGNCLRWGKPTVHCLWTVTDLFQLKIY